MKYISVLFILISVLQLLVYQSEGECSPASDAVSKLEQQHKIDQYHKYGFVCTSVGGGGDGKRFKHLSITFNTKKKLTVNSERKYIIESILSFIRDINTKSSLEQHFTEWPLPIEKIGYRIQAQSNDGLMPKFPNGIPADNMISYVEFHEGTIDYHIMIASNRLPQTVHRETLEEAIAILKAEGWKEPVDYNSQVN